MAQVGLKIFATFLFTLCSLLAPSAYAGSIPSGYVRIASLASQRCLDVKDVSLDDSAPVQQWDCWGGGNQQWQLQAVTSELYQIVSLNSGKCLDITQRSWNNGQTLQQYGCGGLGSPNQLWRIEFRGESFVHFVSAYNGKCVDLTNGQIDNGVLLQQWDCDTSWNNPNQIFSLGEDAALAVFVATTGTYPPDSEHGFFRTPVAIGDALAAFAARPGLKPRYIYFREGNYDLAEALNGKPLDLVAGLHDGLTLETFPLDAHRGAILNGLGRSIGAFRISASRVSVRNLTLKNFNYWGVAIHGGLAFPDSVAAIDAGQSDPILNINLAGQSAADNVVADCDIGNIDMKYSTSSLRAHDNLKVRSWNTGTIVAEGLVPNTQILSNTLHDTGSMGLRISADEADSDISGSVVGGNYVYNTLLRQDDGGAIYLRDLKQSSTGIRIENNSVSHWKGSSISFAAGIYLDDGLSNAVVTGNVLMGTPSMSPGQVAMAFQIHGGRNNDINGNMLHLGSSGRVAAVFYNRDNLNSMDGNAFTRNIVLSNNSDKAARHSYLMGGSQTDGLNPLQVSQNIYFNTTSRTRIDALGGRLGNGVRIPAMDDSTPQIAPHNPALVVKAFPFYVPNL